MLSNTKLFKLIVTEQFGFGINTDFKALKNIKNGRINGSEVIIDYEDEEKISLRVVYHITEEVGYFRERN